MTTDRLRARQPAGRPQDPGPRLDRADTHKDRLRLRAGHPAPASGQRAPHRCCEVIDGVGQLGSLLRAKGMELLGLLVRVLGNVLVQRLKVFVECLESFCKTQDLKTVAITAEPKL